MFSLTCDAFKVFMLGELLNEEGNVLTLWYGDASVKEEDHPVLDIKNLSIITQCMVPTLIYKRLFLSLVD